MSENELEDVLCSMLHCMRLAEVWYEDQPMCIDCADELIDRQAAISMHGDMRHLLPDLGDR